ncbi:DUF4345 domain-containing protein [Arthrobacter sp. NPDC092385]|uniref:DUF4345 domain-containing protein n=1 Tax=Arthrobacter sp. NPDC092385 TaxID=3363943 RepID=UPI00382F1399
MTSNSPEHDNSASEGAARPSERRRPDGTPSGTPAHDAGGTLRPADVSGAGTTAAGRGPASTSASGDSTTSTTSTTSKDTTDRARGKKAGKGAASGGDWNVFRTVVVLVGLVIAGFGAYYLILGTAGLPDTEADPVNPTLESQFRFFAAMMVGVGAAFITIAIKFQWANMLWLVCLMVFVGGIGRVLSWAFSGTPNYVLIVLMVVELAFPPALLVWHKYIAKTSDLRQEFAQRS